MDKLKLQWKVFAFLLGFSTLLIAILWFFQTVFLTDMYKMVRKGELEKAIALIVPTKEFLMPDRPMGDNRGRLQPETITQEKVFTLQDGRTISLTFYAMITPVDATVSTLRTQLYIITGIMFLLSVVLSIVIARYIARPIAKINESAKVLATGSYDTHFNGHGFLEIKELLDTLNTAAIELSKVESLRRELVANVSHDLRTPLALIYSYAEMMHDFPDEIIPEQTQIIMDETNVFS
ncbi:HAMP domain-containing histidine kinase [Desulfitobacterium sp. LBE]|uniref:HAMP domain-containing histidine kinase n=1 Tax=Desulfitobacterium sp. LBE TaxID=884086 RepID=UPI00155A79FF|nr:HAMP domain-containing histidine kinase [Desulfitobacterium sp. LBE]